jgi:O-antigen ligase
LIYLLIASFFYANVVYRISVGSYGYILASDIASWLFIFFVLFRKLFLQSEGRKFERFDWSLLVFNLLMYLLLFQIYFMAFRVFSEFGRAAADTLRFTQFILCYFAVRSYLHSSLMSVRYLFWVFVVATIASAYGLIVDIVLQLPRIYVDITRDIMRPKEFSAFFTNNHASASVYLISALSVGFGLLFKKGNPLHKGLILSCMATMILAVIFSRSRAGIAGLGISTAMFILSYLRFRGRNIFAMGGLLVIVVVFGTLALYAGTDKNVTDRIGIGSIGDITHYEYRSDFIRSTDRKIGILSVKARFENWRESIEIIKNMSMNIFFGYGVNQQSFKIKLGGAHNNFLQVIIDMGIVGLVVFLLFLYEMERKFKKPPSTKDSYLPNNAMRLGMRCGFWGLVATSFTQETFYMRPALGNFFGFYLILVAIISSLPKESIQNDTKNTEERNEVGAANPLYC